MKTNKIISLTLGVAVTTLLSVSCSDSFLDTSSKTDLNSGSFYKNPLQAEYALTGCYDGYRKAADLAIKEYPERRIVVIDGKSACSGEGLLAYYAMEKRDGGATLDETLLTPLTESFSSGGVRKRSTLAGSVVMSKVPWWSMVPPRRR